MSRIAYFKCLGPAKVHIKSGGQPLSFDFRAGVLIAITFDGDLVESINFKELEVPDADEGTNAGS